MADSEIMADSEKLVAELIEAAGGEMVGRVRLQKVTYLLDRLGLESGFAYDYHHYGPYSEGLAIAVDDAKADRLVREEVRHRELDGIPYSIFKTNDGAVVPGSCIGALERDRVVDAIGKMQRCSATVLELAATVVWLIEIEEVSDWRSELQRRKGAKAADDRTEKAVRLLTELGLFERKQ